MRGGDDLLARVRELVAEVADLEVEEVGEDGVLWEEEGGLALDSLDALRLALLLAEEYGLEEPGEIEMAGIRTVRDVAERLAQLIPNGGGP
jgi:acyl carrier protein